MTPDGKKLRVTTEKLTHLPESIGTLDGLEILNLSDCSQLSELPDAISGLKALTQLNLEGCSSLAALPAAIGGLGALRLLYLRGCSSLVALPDAIGELKALTHLSLKGCSSLAALPAAIGELKALTKLYLGGCASLAALPATIGELGALTELYLGGCASLTALPNAISELSALTALGLEGCSSLTALPDTIRAMPGLTVTGCNEVLERRSRRFRSVSSPPDDALRCPISTALLVKPLRAKPCGHVYSKASVQGYYKGARKKCVVFGCEATLSSWDFVPDVPTEIALENYKERLQTTDADEAADEAREAMQFMDVTDRGQPEEERWAEVERKMLEDREGARPLSDFDRLRLRRLRRRVCDTCGRQGTLEVERFPVCYCGDRRYCDEACQQADWDRGHSATCASGHTFPQEMLDKLREIRRIKNHERIRDTIFKQFPPPADRPR
jgi:hypothetical protein